MHDFFPQPFGPDSFHETERVDLGGGEPLGLPAVMRKFNMETFAGPLVELTALSHLGWQPVLRALRAACAFTRRPPHGQTAALTPGVSDRG